MTCFWPTRDLLPVRDFELNVRDYVWTSVDPVFENIGEIARETRAIYALDEPGGYYMGVLRDVKGGIGVSRGRTSVVSLDNKNIAHELGHNFGLSHAPCIRGFILSPDEVLTDVDPQYPYDGGSIGVWGYDDNNSKRRTGGYSLDHLFEYGTNLGNVVDPRWFRDIMGYCYPEWISGLSLQKGSGVSADGGNSWYNDHGGFIQFAADMGWSRCQWRSRAGTSIRSRRRNFHLSRTLDPTGSQVWTPKVVCCSRQVSTWM